MPVERVDLRIMASVAGIESLHKLEHTLENLKQKELVRSGIKQRIIDTNERLLAQIKLDIIQRKLQIRGATTHVNQIVKEQVRLEMLNATYERSLKVKRDNFIEDIKSGKVKLSKAQQQGFVIMMEEKEAEAARLTANAYRTKRREVLANTMAIFGMTMSIWQITNAFSALAGENKELKKDMQKLQAVMMGATGPIMLAMGIHQLSMAWANLNMTIKIGMPLFFTMAALYMTMTASSRELKIIFGALTGALAGLTAIIIQHNIAKWQGVVATWASVQAKLSELGVSSLGLALPIAFAAIGAGLAYYATIPKESSAQTELGQYRMLLANASFRGHKGETVSRPIEDWGRDRRGMGNAFFIVDSQIVDRSEAKRIQFNEYVGLEV